MRGKGRKARENAAKNFSKKVLDTSEACPYSPPPVAILKGVVTGEGIGGTAWKHDAPRAEDRR